MAISHIHTSPPLLCLLEVHICSELTFFRVLSCWSRSGRPRGAGAALRDEIRPVLSHICLYWAVNSLKVGPHLFSFFKHRYSSETEFWDPQNFSHFSLALAVPSLSENLNISFKIETKCHLPGSGCHDQPHPTPPPFVDLITSYAGPISLLTANVIIIPHVTQKGSPVHIPC